MRSGFINHGTTFGHKSIVYDSTYFCLCCSKLEILIKLDNLHKVNKYFNEPNRHQHRLGNGAVVITWLQIMLK